MKGVPSFSQIVWAACLCAASFSGAACHRQASAIAAFPPSNDVVGWMKTSDVRTFDAADLWKYIDGEAEKYLKAGVQRASTADYKFQNKLDAVVDIYTMSATGGAAQVLDSEPAAGAKVVPVGDEARLFTQSLVFRKGPYLVRIVSFQEAAEAEPALLALGRAIEQRLGR